MDKTGLSNKSNPKCPPRANLVMNSYLDRCGWVVTAPVSLCLSQPGPLLLCIEAYTPLKCLVQTPGKSNCPQRAQDLVNDPVF